MPLPVALFMSLAFAGVGSLLLRGGWPDLKRAIASRRWAKTTGLIEETTETTHLMKGDGGSSHGIEYTVKYCYVLADQPFTGRWTSLTSSSNRPGACPFKKGDLAEVYYDPANPASSRLFSGVKAQDLFLFSGGLFFVLASVFPIMVYLALRK